MKTKVDELIEILKTARQEISIFKPNGKYFDNHSIEYNDVINYEQLELIEKEHSIVLPHEYKEFVSKIGNGGNQPKMGMFSVQDSIKIRERVFYEYNLDECDVLLKQYFDFYRTSYYCTENREFDKEHSIDDYFDYETCIFRFKNLFYNDNNSYQKLVEQMKMHLLIFSAHNTVPIEYAIALDGIYKNRVVYFEDSLVGKNIKITNKTFLDWNIEYYKHALECRDGYYTSL